MTDGLDTPEKQLDYLESLYLDEYPGIAKQYLDKAIGQDDRAEMMVRSMSPVLSFLAARRQLQAAGKQKGILEDIRYVLEATGEEISALKETTTSMHRQSDAMTEHSSRMISLNKWTLGISVLVFVAVIVQIVVAILQLVKG